MARIASPMTDIRDLIVAAGASDSDLEDVVRQIGVERVADMLVYELIDRADLSELGDTADVTVQFELRAGDRRVARAVRARGGTAACEAGTAASPDATVVQDLVDLARAVFGPRPERANATRSIVWRDPGAAGTPSRSRWANEAPQVTHRLLRGSEGRPEDLAELLLRFGAGRWGIHRSPQQYARHFGPLRDRSLTILELPAGDGLPHRRGGQVRAAGAARPHPAGAPDGPSVPVGRGRADRPAGYRDRRLPRPPRRHRLVRLALPAPATRWDLRHRRRRERQRAPGRGDDRWLFHVTGRPAELPGIRPARRGRAR